MKPANRAPICAACCYPYLAEICRSHGYALSVHGSLARDFDLVAIPWAETVSPPQEVLDSICGKFSVRVIGEPGEKQHGRVAYTLAWLGEAFMDFSFMPAMAPEGD